MHLPRDINQCRNTVVTEGRWGRGWIGQLFSGEEKLLLDDTQKVRFCNNFFASVLTRMINCSWGVL